MIYNLKHAALLLVTAALIFTGCNEESIVSTDRASDASATAADQPADLSRARKGRPISAVMKIDPDFFFGEQTITDGVLHIRKQRPVGIIEGEMVGTVDSEWSVDILLATRKGPAQGMFTFTVTELFGKPVTGAFVGGALGEITLADPSVEGDYIRHPGRLLALGTGNLKGMILTGTYSTQAPGFEGHTGPAFTLDLGVRGVKNGDDRADRDDEDEEDD